MKARPLPARRLVRNDGLQFDPSRPSPLDERRRIAVAHRRRLHPRAERWWYCRWHDDRRALDERRRIDGLGEPRNGRPMAGDYERGACGERNSEREGPDRTEAAQGGLEHEPFLVGLA
jgi:hypothetical protein